MRRILIAAAILTFAPACSEENPDTDAILALSGDTANGKLAYDNNCASCHMADGSGNDSLNYPSLAEHAKHESDSEIITIVLDGEGAMPSFRANLSDQEVADILAYMRAEWG